MSKEVIQVKEPSGGVTEQSNDAIGCLFCRSGAEDRIISELKISHPGINALSPKKIRIRRYGGMAVEEQVTLFPGYIFFNSTGDTEFRGILSKQDVYRLLTYPNGDWNLRGDDRAIAEMMFNHNGVIGLSKAFYEGDSVHIADGALKDLEGSIIKLNKRAKTAQVKIEFAGKNLILWLGYEIIDPVYKRTR